ncbi:MAG: ubiquinol-cytochrome C chaperone family protein [Pseudomonadota bacterium]
MRLIPQTLIPGFLRPRTPRQAVSLYETLLLRAREPVFYTDWGVPDTMDGRLEVLQLHLALLFRRLGAIAPHGPDLWRDTLDHAMGEIERAMRDVGVGDVTVPKKMRRVAEAFYGRAKAYGEALDADDRAALADALARNVYAEPPHADALAGLAGDAVVLDAALRAAPDAELMAGRLTLAAPHAAPIGEDRHAAL